MHQRTNFRRDRSNRCRDIAIFVIFFKMAAVAILDFQKFNIFTVRPVPGVNVRHHAKFHHDRSQIYGDLTFFFQNATLLISIYSFCRGQHADVNI